MTTVFYTLSFLSFLYSIPSLIINLMALYTSCNKVISVDPIASTSLKTDLRFHAIKMLTLAVATILFALFINPSLRHVAYCDLIAGVLFIFGTSSVIASIEYRKLSMLCFTVFFWR